MGLIPGNMPFRPQIFYCHEDILEIKEDHTMKAYKKQISSWKKKIRASDYFPRCLNLGLHFIHWSTRATELLLKQHYHDLESDEAGSERDDFKSGQPAIPLTTTSYKQKTAEVIPPDC